MSSKQHASVSWPLPPLPSAFRSRRCTCRSPRQGCTVREKEREREREREREKERERKRANVITYNAGKHKERKHTLI